MADITDLYALLLGDSGDAQAEARAIAQKLRGSRGTQALTALGDEDPVGALGAVSARNATLDQANLFNGLAKRAQYGEERHNRLAGLQQAKLLAQAQIAAAKANSALQVADLKGWYGLGRQQLENEGKIGVEDKKLQAPPKLKVFGYGEVKDLQEAGRLSGVTRNLVKGFQPEFAGMGVLGGAKTAISRMAGSDAPKEWQPSANWWADYRRNLELIQKHKLFGSAFTQTEANAWNAANLIREGSRPEVVKEAIENLSDAMDRYLSGHVQGRVKEGYSPEAADLYTKGGGKSADSELEALLKDAGL